MARQVTTSGRAEAVDLADVLTLLQSGRTDEGVALAQQALNIDPRHPLALRLYASGAAELGRFADAKRALSQAQASGPEALEIQATLGRVHFLEGDYGRAERTWRQVLEAQQDHADAHRGLIDAIWIQTEDIDAALAPIDAAIRTHPRGPSLLALRLDALRGAGRLEEAWTEARAVLERGEAGFAVALVAATLALELGHAEESLDLAHGALAAAPDHPKAVDAVNRALLATGQARESLELSQQILRRHPDRQDVLALWATAARLIGHPNYGKVYDYAAFVRPARIATPSGWSDLSSYLSDLKQALIRVHGARARPLDQSLRHGTQTAGDLSRVKDRPIQAFFSAIQPLVEAYMRELGTGPDPVRRRNTGAYAVQAAWSVRLQPGGHHVDHVHPMGWLSSAFYVETPEAALASADRQGWLQFGRPGIMTRPSASAQHFVRPEPGMLVLFPSYMWHGTVPFMSDESRMTIAFDLRPA